MKKETYDMFMYGIVCICGEMDGWLSTCYSIFAICAVYVSLLFFIFFFFLTLLLTIYFSFSYFRVYFFFFVSLLLFCLLFLLLPPLVIFVFIFPLYFVGCVVFYSNQLLFESTYV